MLAKRKRFYGWMKDIPDTRDYPFKAVSAIPPSLPEKVDLRDKCSPVEDQGNLGSCTANALAGALEYLDIINKGTYIDASRLFIYYNERAIINTIRSDSGARLRDGIKTLKKDGVCSEKKWPYDIAKFTKKPLASCFKEALDHQITSYEKIRTLTEMKTCLAEGFPFVFGFAVYESFEAPEVAKTGVVVMPGKNEDLLGGHAVLAVGYDDTTQRIIVKNSWGTKWGMKGYFTMPYAYVSNRELADDFWVIRASE